MATVQIDFSDFRALQQQVEDANAETARVRALLEKTAIADPAGRVEMLYDGWKAALDIVRFAVANLSPEFISSGWPQAAIRDVAKLLKTWPSSTYDDQAFAVDLEALVREISAFERDRQVSSR